MTNIWGPTGNRVAALSPGPDDLFVVTTLFGKVVSFQPISEYRRALIIAEAFAHEVTGDRPITIKILCLSGQEAMAFLNVTPEELFQNQSLEEETAMKEAIVSACTEALLKAPEPTVRQDAFKLLGDLGVTLR